MKVIQSTITFLWMMIAFPLCSMAQKLSVYQEMQLTGRINPVDNLRYVDSVEVTYINSNVYPSGERISIKVPVQNERFSLWVPPLPVGDFMFVRFLYGKVPDSADKIDPVAGYPLMVGDSSVDLSFEKGEYNNGAGKYGVNVNILTGKQNRVRISYTTAADENYRTRGTLKMKLYEKRIDSAFYLAEIQKLSQKLNEFDKQFIIDNPGALHSLFLLEKMVGKYLDTANSWNNAGASFLKEIDTLFGSLHTSLRESKKGRHLIAGLQRAREGRVIPFTGTMPDGRQFNLDSLKGKVFLIDFWGSWCGWCRKGHPHLKILYAKYKEKGFEIIGVGQEFGVGKTQWEKFKKAIAEDGIAWSQVLNDPSKQDIVSQYMVTSYPSKFLVNRDGRIILRVGIDSERLLDAKLRELFGD